MKLKDIAKLCKARGIITLTQMGGKLTMESREGDTVFSGFVPRNRLELPENTENCEESAQKNDNSIN